MSPTRSAAPFPSSTWGRTGHDTQESSHGGGRQQPVGVAVRPVAPSRVPTTKDQCKNGGWRNFGVFKNQGDCVSFVATGGKNPPAGYEPRVASRRDTRRAMSQENVELVRRPSMLLQRRLGGGTGRSIRLLSGTGSFGGIGLGPGPNGRAAWCALGCRLRAARRSSASSTSTPVAARWSCSTTRRAATSGVAVESDPADGHIPSVTASYRPR